MMLIDAGPLVAIIDKGDSHHRSCVELLHQLPAIELITSWPCFTEAMHILGAVGGSRFQKELWGLWSSQTFLIQDLVEAEIEQCSYLMHQYRDRPMDLADASIVALGNSLGIRQLITLDSDFRIYRLQDGAVFDILP